MLNVTFTLNTMLDNWASRSCIWVHFLVGTSPYLLVDKVHPRAKGGPRTTLLSAGSGHGWLDAIPHHPSPH